MLRAVSALLTCNMQQNMQICNRNVCFSEHPALREGSSCVDDHITARSNTKKSFQIADGQVIGKDDKIRNAKVELFIAELLKD